MQPALTELDLAVDFEPFAIGWSDADREDGGRAAPPCRSPEPVTLWLDGRRGPYDVTLPVDRSGLIW